MKSSRSLKIIYRKMLPIFFFSISLLGGCSPTTAGSEAQSSLDREIGSLGRCGDYTKFSAPSKCEEMEGTHRAEVMLGNSLAAEGSGIHENGKSGHACVVKTDGKTVRMDVIQWFSGIESDPSAGSRDNGFFYVFQTDKNGKKTRAPSTSYKKSVLLATKYRGFKCRCDIGPEALQNCVTE